MTSEVDIFIAGLDQIQKDRQARIRAQRYIDEYNHQKNVLTNLKNRIDNVCHDLHECYDFEEKQRLCAELKELRDALRYQQSRFKFFGKLVG